MKKQNTDTEKAAQLRRKAEEKLKLRKSKTKYIASEADVLKLIHELEVHQIELEMQNEELVIAKDMAELAQEKYTSLFDFAPSAYYILSSKSEILEINLAGAKMLGKERQKLMNSRLDLFVSNDSTRVFTDFLSNVFLDKGSQNCELNFLSKDGKTKSVQLTGTLIENSKHCMISGVDISERKQAEQLILGKNQEIVRRNEELRQNNILLNTAKEKAEGSEKKFRSIFNRVADAIFIYDSETYEIIEANKATSEIYGYSSDELIGMSCLLFSDEIEKSKATAEIILQKKEAKVNLRNHLKKDGTRLYVQVQGYKIELDNRPIIFAVCQDITEVIKSQQELIAAKEKAEQSDRLKSAFLANMSHEIRTPMNGILGFAELLKSPDISGSEQQRYIEIIEKSGDRMLNIINDIIDISKIEAGLMELDLKVSNINEQIEYVYTFFKPEADAKGIQLSYSNPLPQKDVFIKTDHEKIFAIFTNLVKNALKFTNTGSIEFGYQYKAEHEPSELEFYVKDTGIGVPKDRQAAVFERFIQADIADKNAYQGSGLGLTISKAYVEMIGGKIWVESEEGKGSAFYFTIPFNAQHLSKHTGDDLLPAENNVDIRKLKTLVVEDDETSAELIDHYLKRFCKVVLKAKDGSEAIEICHYNPDLDLILMDIRMSGMGGYEATKQIRKFNKETVIIAQTAYAQSGDKEIAIKAGCNDYISKPINRVKLYEMIFKYFGD